MFKKLITSCAKGIRFVKIQRPAKEKEIKAAEAAVGYCFPAELTQLLSELNGDRWLFFSTEEIIHTTQIAREGLRECYPDIDRHIFFAGNGCGDYYCYNILPDDTVETTAIYIWEHETNETHQVASSLSELIVRYYHDEI